MSLDWAETKLILLEVEQLFSRDDDIKDINDIQKMQNEIDLYCANSLKDSKELIKEMTARVAAKESEIIAPSEAAHSIELEKVIGDKENVQRQIESLRQVIDQKRENVYKLASNSLALKEKMAVMSANSQVSDARTAYALSLYSKISNITWDYTAPRGKLGGVIGNDEKKELRKFELDTRQMTSFEVTNQLWNLIENNV